MKYLSLTLLLTSGLIYSAARKDATKTLLPIVKVGTAQNEQALTKLPYSVCLKQDLNVFDPPVPSRMVANFWTNSPELAQFLREKFIPIFQSFKSADKITSFSYTYEPEFNKLLSEKLNTKEHVEIIKTAAVKFSLMHLLADKYCNITSDDKLTQTAIFPDAYFNGGQGGNPYSSYEYMDNKTFVLHYQQSERTIRAVDGALAAKKTPDEAALLALDTITSEPTWKVTELPNKQEMLSVVHVILQDKAGA